ncbi:MULTISPECIES: TetR/AcrR family transcriptional regulator [Streptomyces]|uniref:Transcriptional regulator n=1 Tax=Streptomyces cacaoi TaxID=1898 RepID=A0A4Y3QTU9_STRCI|nr:MULTISPECIES: TetR/AcrR family transcriptional regulator [Streptomyces]NNG86574.1 TetR family transcriptional regulator [Streptomyces cacaoi]QHF97458.1 TetR family transcriptional regulator [Streptomyces sp. NHF165]GEB48824.1 transcriptional regulator [Streptomyces cacaoi]
MSEAARRRDGANARERMLHEAMTAIAEGGLADLTMSALARRLGTSGGHILYYFGSKDRLLAEALRWSESALAEQRTALLRRRVTAHRKLDLFIDLYLPQGPRDPRWTLWIELWARTGTDAALGAIQDELDQGWQRDLESLLAKGVAQGRFAVPAEEVPARAGELLALLDGLSTRAVLSRSAAEADGARTTARAAATRLIPRTPPGSGARPRPRG